MAKTYRIILQIQAQAAEASARRAEMALQRVEQAATRATQSTQRATNRSNQEAVASKRLTAEQLGSIEDRYLAREYKGRVAHARRVQQQSERDADRLQSIQDRYTQRDYRQRVRGEARKQREAEREAQKSLERGQREADQLQSIQDRYTQRDYRDRVRYAAKKEREADRAAQKSAAQAQRDADRAAAQKQREADQLAAIEDKWLRREQRERTAYQRRKQVDQDREAQRAVTARQRQVDQLASIEDRWLRREYRERVVHQRKLEEQAEASADRMQGALASGAKVTLAVGMGALGLLFKEFERVHERAQAATEETLALRKFLRPEAALKNEPQANNKVLAESIGFRVKTGLGQAEASDFTRQYIGSLPIALEKGNIDQKTADALMVEAGKMAARQGGDAGTRGELAGLLGQFGKVRSVEHGMAQLEGIRQALVAGRGDDTPLTRQLLKVAGEMVGEGERVPTLNEMGALIGTTSLSAGQGAPATRVRRINRFLTETKGKGADFLKRIGIGEQDTLEERIDKLMPVLMQAKAQGRDVTAFLGQQVGGGNQAEIEAVRELLNVYQPFKQRMARARAAEANGGAVIKADNEFLKSPEGRVAQGEALKKAAEVALGLKGERYAALQREAEASPEFQAEEGSVVQRMKDYMDGMLGGHLPFMSDPQKFGRDTRLESHMYRILSKKARAAGVTEDEETRARVDSYAEGGENWFPEFVNRLEKLISEHGGTNAVDITPALDRLNATLEESNRLMKAQQRPGGAPPPLPGPPPGGPMRGG